jgi:hypothetical protein
MKKLLLLAGVAMIGLTGCSSVHKGVTSGVLQEKVTAEHIANVQVGGKISGVSSAKVLFGFITIGGDNQFVDGMSYAGESASLTSSLPLPLPIPSVSDGMSKLKSSATYKALESSGADVIIAPTYKTTVKNDFFVYKELEARVDGYKGTITGFTQKK